MKLTADQASLWAWQLAWRRNKAWRLPETAWWSPTCVHSGGGVEETFWYYNIKRCITMWEGVATYFKVVQELSKCHLLSTGLQPCDFKAIPQRPIDFIVLWQILKAIKWMIIYKQPGFIFFLIFNLLSTHWKHQREKVSRTHVHPGRTSLPGASVLAWLDHHWSANYFLHWKKCHNSVTKPKR